MLTANTIRVDEADRDEIMLGIKRTPVGDSKGLVSNGMSNRTPDIDNAHTTFQKTVCVWAEMTVDASDAGVEGLVDVDPFLDTP